MQWTAFLPHIRHLPPNEQDAVQRAFDLCIHAHRTQKRKSGEPYASHPIAVAEILAEMGADTDTIIAALLHDVLEDTSTSAADLAAQFGEATATLIEGVTKLDNEEIRAHPTLDEEIESLRKMVTAMQKDARLMVIKLVDRLHNMRTISFLSPKRQIEFAQETLDVYVKIADRLSMQNFRDELEGLCMQILEPATYAQLQEQRGQNKGMGEKIVQEMNAHLRTEDGLFPEWAEICFEHKTWNHLKNGLLTPETTVGKRSSITTILLCDTIPQCYEILGILHQCWPHEILSFKDFIGAPAVNGYRGLHTTIILPKGVRVRCKIRTHDMHAYARLGITTFCFDRQAHGPLHSLPWAEHISPVAVDTAQKSSEFWDSMQSDILGRSILIYGPDGSAVDMPKGATALDAAFYLFKDKALKTKTIKINGKEMPFFSPLTAGDSLSLILDTNLTITRDWLEWVHTGVSTAMIRSLLGSASRKKRINSGRNLLQESMFREARGYLKEFKEESLLTGLRALGYSTLDEAFIAIADGHLQASTAVSAIFRPKDTQGNTAPTKKISIINFTIPMMSLREASQHFLFIEKKYGISIKNIRIFPHGNRRIRITIRFPLSTEERRSIAIELASTLATDVQVKPVQGRLRLLGVVLLVLLWGLDCLLGKRIILSGVSPFDLTALRFFMLFLLASAYVIPQYFKTREWLQLKWISPFNSHLLLAGGAIFTTALASYTAVQYIPALTYALCMNLGTILTDFPRAVRSRPLRHLPFIFSIVGFIILLGVVLIRDVGSFLHPLFFVSIGGGFSYAIYTYASSRYLKQESVSMRYPQFILFFSLLALLLSLPAALSTGFVLLSSPMLFPSLLFTVFLTALPYLLYFELLKREGIERIGRYIPLFLFVVIVGEPLVYDRTVGWLLPFLITLLLLSWVFFHPTSTSALSNDTA